MLAVLKHRLGLKRNKSSTADQTGPRPSRPSSMIATKRRRRSAEVLRHDDPVIDDGRDSGQRDGPSMKTCEVFSGFPPNSVTQTCDSTTCRHDFVKSCFWKLCDVGSSRCTVCRRFVWKFWKIQTCVECGQKKHKNCVFEDKFTATRTALESGDLEQNASPSSEQIVSTGLEPSNKTHTVIGSPPADVRENDSETDQAVAPQEASAGTTGVVEASEQTRAVEQTSATLDDGETGCADGFGAFERTCPARIVLVETPALLGAEAIEKGQTDGMESSLTKAVTGDRASTPDVPENNSETDQRVAPQEDSAETTQVVEASEETRRAVGQASAALEDRETGCADGGVAFERTCPERSVLVETLAPLAAEAFEKGQTAGVESSPMKAVIGDSESTPDVPENNSDTDQRVAPQEDSAEKTQVVEASEETRRAVGQTSAALEDRETGCADGGVAFERNVLVETLAPLAAKAFEKGQTAGVESSLTNADTGDRESPQEVVENESEPDERVAPQEASAETTETAVSTAEDDITTVGEDRSVATSSDDVPLVTVDPTTVRRSPTVREGNVQLYTKYKILPRKNAYWQMTNYMKRVNKFLNNPQEQTSIDHLTKYWLMQNKLFSLFSSGILLDEESFFSVCPEVLSIHIADKCRCETIIDPFCGAGGNIIQFTKTCSRVIGVDVDAKKIKLARNNARVYGVENRIQLLTGDYFGSGARPKADIVFMSPPWGGPEYIYKPAYSLAGMCSEHGGGRRILEIAREIAPKIAIHLPWNLDKNECVMLARDLNFKYIQFERNYIGNQFNSTTVYLK